MAVAQIFVVLFISTFIFDGLVRSITYPSHEYHVTMGAIAVFGGMFVCVPLLLYTWLSSRPENVAYHVVPVGEGFAKCPGPMSDTRSN